MTKQPKPTEYEVVLTLTEAEAVELATILFKGVNFSDGTALGQTAGTIYSALADAGVNEDDHYSHESYAKIVTNAQRASRLIE